MRNVLRKAVTGITVAGAVTVTSLFGGVASAGVSIDTGVGDLQEGAMPVSTAADGDVDGRDFLIWQRGHGPSQGTGIGNLSDWQTNYGQTAAADSGAAASDPEWKYISVRRY